MKLKSHTTSDQDAGESSMLANSRYLSILTQSPYVRGKSGVLYLKNELNPT